MPTNRGSSFFDMLDEAPHILQVRTLTDPVYDTFGRQITESEETWSDLAECFCHDNSQMKQISVNGELWTYAYHIVYEGEGIPLGTKVRCVSRDGNGFDEIVGEGEVKKKAACYSSAFLGRRDIWI